MQNAIMYGILIYLNQIPRYAKNQELCFKNNLKISLTCLLKTFKKRFYSMRWKYTWETVLIYKLLILLISCILCTILVFKPISISTIRCYFQPNCCHSVLNLMFQHRIISHRCLQKCPNLSQHHSVTTTTKLSAAGFVKLSLLKPAATISMAFF